MLLDDQCAPERHHEEDTQKTAAQGNHCDGEQRWFFCDSLLCPDEKDRQREDAPGRNGFSRGSHGLHDVVLQYGIPLQDHSYDPHRDDSRRNGCRHRQSYAQSQIGIGRAEDDGQQHAHNNGCLRDLRQHAVRRDVRFEFFAHNL